MSEMTDGRRSDWWWNFTRGSNFGSQVWLSRAWMATRVVTMYGRRAEGVRDLFVEGSSNEVTLVVREDHIVPMGSDLGVDGDNAYQEQGRI